jgi:uncharacterized protein
VNLNDTITGETLDVFPRTEAIYLFGSAAENQLRSDSDIDVAVLLPSTLAREIGTLAMHPLRQQLEAALNRAVDLVNLRTASTVFQNEVIVTGQRIFSAASVAVDEFEMHVLSLYQKLSAERAGILADGLSSGRFYRV